MMRMHRIKVVAGAVLALGIAGSAAAEETVVKKTLDGRCLAPDHPDYWETKVYVAKPSMADCLKSGGKQAD